MTSRQFYPNNNCYDFTIKFPQGSGDYVQYRISQCNRYQVVNLRLPIRANKGIQASYLAQVPFHSHVIKSIPNLPITAGGVQYNKKFGRIDRVQYTETHEELKKDSLNNRLSVPQSSRKRWIRKKFFKKIANNKEIYFSYDQKRNHMTS